MTTLDWPEWLTRQCITQIQADFNFPLARIWAWSAARHSPIRTLLRGQPWEDTQ